MIRKLTISSFLRRTPDAASVYSPTRPDQVHSVSPMARRSRSSRADTATPSFSTAKTVAPEPLIKAAATSG